jgi:putative pyruvate formate lyase activating enzyme
MIRSTISGLPGVNAFKGTAPGFGLRREAKRHAALAGADEVSKSGVAAALCHRSPKSRSVLARERARIARAALADCHLCEHHCGVNRLAGEPGLCHAGAEARIFMAQAEVSDELELIPTFAIALSGCDLRCDFCITGGPSWNPRAGEPLSVAAAPRRREGGGDALVAARGGGAAFTGLRRGVAATFQPQRFSGLERLIRQAEQALADGARTIMILGGEPTIHLPAALEIVAALPDDAKLVWKTNAHGSAQARALLNGMFDVWLADFKFGNDACAQRLAKVPDYVRVVRENLLWANEHSELMVRHLLMPGHVECCWQPVAEWLAGELPGIKVNLRSGFWPAWHSARHSDLRRTVSNSESAQAWRIARNCGLNLVE